ECIKKNPRSSDYMDSRYEAAWSMEGWFRYLVNQLPETKDVIDETVSEVTSFYLSSKEPVRLAVINGFLEHLFETPKLRSYFQHWKTNPILAEGYNWALLWGKDHETNEIIKDFGNV
ncbi:MAG TPA: hypothetical protein VFG11_03315, partial [Acidobacteriota bacterium]|nr:hypothetical protein [Acidobacteriota bacterium]